MKPESQLTLIADHAGFELKELIKVYLQTDFSFEIRDLSPNFVTDDDYPEVVSKLLVGGNHSNSRILALCGSGVGMTIALNKIKHIRAFNAYNDAITISAREDNNCNALCLGARFVDFGLAKIIVRTFLTTKFSDQARHTRRVNELDLLFEKGKSTITN